MAAGVRGTWMLVWSLPLTFSFIFLLGFLTFLLSVGFALMTTAWWIQRKLATWRSLAILLLAVVGCQGVHRAGGAMAVLFLGCCEVMPFIRSGSTWGERWREVNPVLRILGLAMAGLFGAWKVIVAVTTTPRTDLPDEQDRWQELFQGRPLLLFAPALEGAMLLLLAALLLINIILALFYRMRTSGTTAAADGFGLAVLLMMAASIVFHTPNAQFLFLGARAQTVGLLVLPIWLSAVLPKNLIARSIGIAVLINQIWRMVYCERMMAGAHDTCAKSMEVLEQLPLHGVALASGPGK